MPNNIYAKRGKRTMFEFQHYKEKLEKKHEQELKDILVTYYLTKDLGPSSTANELGVPRQVVQHYINHFGLNEAKQQLIRDKAKNYN